MSNLERRKKKFHEIMVRDEASSGFSGPVMLYGLHEKDMTSEEMRMALRWAMRRALGREAA